MPQPPSTIFFLKALKGDHNENRVVEDKIPLIREALDELKIKKELPQTVNLQ